MSVGVRVFGASIFVLATGILLYAASSKISEKNPFRSSELEAMSASLKKSPQVKIYFSGNVAGMRESCGCALNPKGGFERRFNFLKQEGVLSSQKDDVVLLDFGNLLFKASKFDAKGEKEALENAAKMIEGTNAFHYSAVNLGVLDRTLDTKSMATLWSKSKFPWLSSNVLAPGRFAATFKRRINLKLKNSELVVFGLSSMNDELLAQGWRFEKAADVLENELKDLPKSVFPVVLSDLEMTELVAVASKVSRPVLFLGARETGGWDKPIEIGKALLVHLRQQGQDWGVFKFSPATENKAGWFNPANAESMAQRWDDLKAEVGTLRGLASSTQRSDEEKNIEDKMGELSKLAPSANDLLYSFDTVEMNESFDGHNEVSKFTK